MIQIALKVSIFQFDLKTALTFCFRNLSEAKIFRQYMLQNLNGKFFSQVHP